MLSIRSLVQGLSEDCHRQSTRQHHYYEYRYTTVQGTRLSCSNVIGCDD